VVIQTRKDKVGRIKDVGREKSTRLFFFKIHPHDFVETRIIVLTKGLGWGCNSKKEG